MTIREYAIKNKKPDQSLSSALRDVYRLIENDTIKVVEISTTFTRNRKIKHIVGTI